MYITTRYVMKRYIFWVKCLLSFLYVRVVSVSVSLSLSLSLLPPSLARLLSLTVDMPVAKDGCTPLKNLVARRQQLLAILLCAAAALLMDVV
mgnify:FL=1